MKNTTNNDNTNNNVNNNENNEYAKQTIYNAIFLTTWWQIWWWSLSSNCRMPYLQNSENFAKLPKKPNSWKSSDS